MKEMKKEKNSGMKTEKNRRIKTEKNIRNNSFIRCGLLIFLAIIWTVLLKVVDVMPIGPEGTSVGFATINGWFHNLTGIHMGIYMITDWLGLIPLAICVCFGILGLIQWIKRKKILKVDLDILLLGVYYLIVIAAYILFEEIALNYRPILIEGRLEASYPSSTTLLTVCVMITAICQLKRRIQNATVKTCLVSASVIFTIFMVGGRLISGVHWLTDIIGGLLISAALISVYDLCVGFIVKKGN